MRNLYLFILFFTPQIAIHAQSVRNVQIRGDVQIDNRYFLNDEPGYVGTNLIRRARISVQGSLDDYFSFRIMPDFGAGVPDLQDAYIDFKPVTRVSIRVGKFKSPIGLERLKSPTNLTFPELALPTNLVPIRDTGIQISTATTDGALQIQAGIFNGALDGSNLNSDYNRSKDVMGRILYHPFRSSGVTYLAGLGIGIAGSIGNQAGTPTAPRLPTYSSGGRQNIFRYRSDGTLPGTVIADGSMTRVAPQLYQYSGPLGLMLEYVMSSHNVSRDLDSRKLSHSAWSIQSAYLLTGEQNGYGAIKPSNPLGKGLGAIELAARIGGMDFDPNTFPIFADPARNARRIHSWAVGMNWYPTDAAKLSMSFEQTRFAALAGLSKKRVK